MPIKVTCYLILPLRYAGSMSYSICDGAGYHITCIPCVRSSVSRLPEDGIKK